MERVLGYLTDYRRISGLWDASRDSYETWKAQPNGCGERDMEAALRGFVADYEYLSADVDSTIAAVQFTITEVGSTLRERASFDSDINFTDRHRQRRERLQDYRLRRRRTDRLPQTRWRTIRWSGPPTARGK